MGHQPTEITIKIDCPLDSLESVDIPGGQASNLSRKPDPVCYVFAYFCIAKTGDSTQALKEKIACPTSIQFSLAIRRAIDGAIREFFGDLSGAPILCYDMLYCRHCPQRLSDMSDNSVAHPLKWPVIFSLPWSRTNQFIAVLSLMNSSFGGGEILSLLGESLTASEKQDVIFYVDVINIYRSLFDVPLEKSI
ncbi:unnamed protein product [Calicophoron daubneyi]|uniref:Uncharacterized protein n=1 Tax=Calicophoron daubneyi TaxID=300641 RepID=A0AAV2TZB3_CALDB